MLDLTATTTVLLDALRSGEDAAAWERLVDRYQPILAGLARASGLDEHDAEDAAQQTLAEFSRDLKTGGFDRSKGRLRAWLTGIARHRIVDVQRARGRGPIVTSESVCCDLADERSVADEWDRAERAAVTAQSLRVLRERSGFTATTLQAFELTVLQGVPPAEVAAELGIGVDDVYVAKSRVTSRLREIFAQVERTYREDA